MYDIVVIGAGPGGYVAAIRAAQLGQKVAIIEQRQVGGTCLNRGCIPTKTLLHTAELYQEMKHSEIFGIIATEPQIDFSKLYQRKEDVSATLRQGIEQLLKGNGIDQYFGVATIIEQHMVQICADHETSTIETKAIIIATGAVPALVPIAGNDLPNVMTSDELLAKDDGIFRSEERRVGKEC